MTSETSRALLVIGYPDLFSAGDHAAPIREYGPIGLEAFQKHVLENMQRKGKVTAGAHLLPEGDTCMEQAAGLVGRYGGSLSGEHGDGQARAELLPKMFGPELVEAFREFKSSSRSGTRNGR